MISMCLWRNGDIYIYIYMGKLGWQRAPICPGFSTIATRQDWGAMMHIYIYIVIYIYLSHYIPVCVIVSCVRVSYNG